MRWKTWALVGVATGGIVVGFAAAADGIVASRICGAVATIPRAITESAGSTSPAAAGKPVSVANLRKSTYLLTIHTELGAASRALLDDIERAQRLAEAPEAPPSVMAKFAEAIQIYAELNGDLREVQYQCGLPPTGLPTGA